MSNTVQTTKNTAKPFLKWAGGKGQLLEKFQKLYPDELKNNKVNYYYEPFAGGAAVFFDVVKKFRIKQASLYDINEELVLAYQVVKNDVSTLLEFLLGYEQKYLPLDKNDRKAFYYDIRETYNRDRFDINYRKYSDNWIPRAAQVIFLNKTCFNGLFRFNNSGGFNTPAGDYMNPKICDSENLTLVSSLLKKTEIKCGSYDAVLKDVEEKSFVYFDPPYRPISKTSSFTSYSRHDFTDESQRQLAEVFKGLDKKGCFVMLSNSDPRNTNPDDNFFDDLYKGFNIKRIPARRSINSDAKKRGELNEIVVTNY
ncbi:MAG: Dam family site-specific DNA-(adenine-N6)-methyltransferase [Bacteroidales bacterium]|nr:Dam family site-specific DNA-(adenine-N6)-methyltransferase [Bacteroidales bacterium]MBN2818945.1 Dam family site-specific DNA-(adenine-N6)-methyltransferase [Bacteroidales bacterium]